MPPRPRKNPSWFLLGKTPQHMLANRHLCKTQVPAESYFPLSTFKGQQTAQALSKMLVTEGKKFLEPGVQLHDEQDVYPNARRKNRR